MRIIRFGVYVALLCCFVGCKSNTKKSFSGKYSEDSIINDFNEKVEVLFAKGFSVENYDRYKKISIINPENINDTLARYVVHPIGTDIDSIKIPNAVYMEVPIKSIACTSTSILGMMPLLGLNENIAGIGNSQYVYDSAIMNMIDSGKIKNISDGMSKNYEQIIMLNPDVLVIDDYSSDEKDKDISDAGINIMYMNNWKEPNILGRAEWLKLMAILFCKNKQADDIFNDIVERYNDVKKEIGIVKDTVDIIWGQDFKGVWYVPGEHSYVTQLLNDAGCKFEYEPNTKNSTPYPLELIFSRHKNSLLWLCQAPVNVKTLNDLISSNEKYKYFDAIKNGKIYSDRKRIGAKGGNDIWESGIYRPDLLLKDIAKITHPELFPDYQLTYWYELK